MRKSLLSLALASILGLGLASCGPTNNPTTVPPTSDPTTEQPTIPPTTVDPTTDPTVDPTVEPTVDPTTDPTVDPTTNPTVEPTVDPTVPEIEIPKIPETPEAGKTRIYFLAESWWHDENTNGTAIFTDELSYPGEAMYEFDSYNSCVVYAYDVDLSLTSSIGFVCYEKDDILPGERVGWSSFKMDTKVLDSSLFDGNKIAVLNETEADTSRSLDVFVTDYIPGKTDYEKPAKPDTPVDPGTDVEKTRIYFMDRDWWNADNAKTSFYYWNLAADTGEYAFPGVTARLLETIPTDVGTVVNVFYADIDTSKYDAILFNRISSDNIEGALASHTLNAQTADIKISEMGENNMIVLSHDEFVYNSNVKCDTLLAKYEEGRWDYGQFATGPVVVEPLPEVITVYYSNISWSSIYCYAWDNEGGSNATWPGELMTKDPSTNIWSYEMSSKYDNLIFNNGQSGDEEQKTPDLVLLGYSVEKPYWNGSSWTAIPGENSNTGETIRVYYKNASWSQIYAYVWDANGNPKAPWPGEAMTEDKESGCYYYEFDAIYVNIIFSNGSGSQTPDISLSSYSNDKPFWNGVAWVSLDNSTDTPVVEKNKVYYKNDAWSQIYAYVWDANGSPKASWPGELMTEDTELGYYYYEFESYYVNIIFTDGKGNQTKDISLAGYSADKPLWNGTTWVALPGSANPDQPEPPAVEPSETNKVYFVPHADWKSDGATFAVYTWNDTNSLWINLVDSDSDGVYEFTLESGYNNVIFCRMNPSGTSNDWSNVWNQSVDETLPTNGANLFTIENPWNSAYGYKATGTWTVFGA